MEAKKATKTVGQHNKTPLGWSKSGRMASKASVTMDSTGSSFSSGGGGSESLSRLEDSALLISPPNQVIVLMVTPHFAPL